MDEDPANVVCPAARLAGSAESWWVVWHRDGHFQDLRFFRLSIETSIMARYAAKVMRMGGGRAEPMEDFIAETSPCVSIIYMVLSK